MDQEPLLLITPNQAAMELLASLLEEQDTPDGEVPVWEVAIPLRITKADLARVMYGNGDLAKIGFWVTESGADAVAFPDPETPRSPFEDSPDA